MVAKPTDERGPEGEPPKLVQASAGPVEMVIEVSAAEAFAEVGRLSMENRKLGSINVGLANEINRLRAVCLAHGIDPDKISEIPDA